MHNLSDRALKERIIGAAVLVVFAVLIVPVFLYGPSGEKEIISESVTLPGQNDQETKQQTIVLEQNRSQPVPAARTPTPAASRPTTVQAAPVATTQAPQQGATNTVVEPATDQSPATTSAASVKTSTTGMWAVQLGSFSSQENAERLASSLRDQGFAAFLSRLQTDSRSLHRVRIGPQKDRESAEAIASQLKKSGHNGQVVPHP